MSHDPVRTGLPAQAENCGTTEASRGSALGQRHAEIATLAKAALSDEKRGALDTFWNAYPEAIQYIVSAAYASGYIAGEEHGFASGRNQRDRQRRGKKGAARPIGRPPRHNALMRELLEKAVDERQSGVTKDDALASVVANLLGSEHRDLFQEFEYLKDRKARSSFLAGQRNRARKSK